MTGNSRDLSTLSVFKGISPEELAAVGELVRTVEWQVGEEVYAKGDSGSSMFAVLQGAVEIFAIVSGVEKRFMTVRAGQVFGLLSILDQGDRPSHARALEATIGIVMDRADLDKLATAQPKVGFKVLSALGSALGRQVRLLTDQFKAAVAWNLEVAGLSSLNLERVMTERIEVTVETLRGEPLTGTLLKFETSGAGHELYLESSDRRVHMIPYHAVVRLSVDRDKVEDREDAPNF